MAIKAKAPPPLRKSSKLKKKKSPPSKAKPSPSRQQVLVKPTMTMQATVAQLAKKLASVERKLTKLGSALNDSKASVDELNEKLAVLDLVLKKSDDIMNCVLSWAAEVDGQLQELDSGHRNLWLKQGANDTGPYPRSNLKSCLELLTDQGGAIPIDGNAAAILRARIKYKSTS